MGVVKTSWLLLACGGRCPPYFLSALKQRTEAEVKKADLARERIPELIDQLLWDFPPEARIPSQYSVPVLKGRVRSLPPPERQALSSIL